MTTDYQPIACGLHDTIELAIMRGQALAACWLDEQDNEHVGKLTPKDTLTLAKEEFLVAEDEDGKEWRIRLDRLSFQS
ncbi:MAG: transcriptional antiterminator, Rof [Gammaproteobacteria bacterium]